MRPILLALSVLLLSGDGRAQSGLEYGGFVEQFGLFYARRPNASDTLAAAQARLHLWGRAPLGGRLRLHGSWDGRLDTHRDVDRGRWLDFSQRRLREPGGAVSELYVDAKLGRMDLRIGSQQIRWGRADGFNPTDNAVPYGYLDLFSDARIAVPAAKADLYTGKARFEAAWIPFFTPTRLPLLGQRWFPHLPATVRAAPEPGAEPVDVDLVYREGARRFPARTLANGQWGVRYNQLVPRAEFSVSYFDGFDDLPLFRTSAVADRGAARPRAIVVLDREYHRVRIVGADFASSLSRFGIRGEAAYFARSAPNQRDYALFVFGIDRAWGDWSTIVQLAGQHAPVAEGAAPVFPELGMRSTLLFRIERTLSPAASFEVKGAARLRDGDFMLRPLYTRSLSNRWRLRLGATLIGGPEEGFFGQYRDSSRAELELRYTF
jgi:hypothetical protein